MSFLWLLVPISTALLSLWLYRRERLRQQAAMFEELCRDADRRTWLHVMLKRYYP